MKNTKPWWQSKTVILAVVQAVGGVVAALAEAAPPEIAWIALGKSVVDVVLRFWTNQAIAD